MPCATVRRGRPRHDDRSEQKENGRVLGLVEPHPKLKVRTMSRSYRELGLILALVAIVVAGGLWASGYTGELYRRIVSMLGLP